MAEGAEQAGGGGGGCEQVCDGGFGKDGGELAGIVGGFGAQFGDEPAVAGGDGRLERDGSACWLPSRSIRAGFARTPARVRLDRGPGSIRRRCGAPSLRVFAAVACRVAARVNCRAATVLRRETSQARRERTRRRPSRPVPRMASEAGSGVGMADSAVTTSVPPLESNPFTPTQVPVTKVGLVGDPV